MTFIGVPRISTKARGRGKDSDKIDHFFNGSIEIPVGRLHYLYGLYVYTMKKITFIGRIASSILTKIT